MLDYQPRADLLADRTILVTGAGAGLGRAASLAYARHGATVILLGRTIAKLEQVYDEIEAMDAPQPAIYPMNLEGASPKDYEDLAITLEENFGRLDGILHNAAFISNRGPMQMVDTESWYKTLQINLNAPFMLTQAVFPLLQQSEDASVIFTSDRVGRRGKAFWGAYSASKFALEGMMQCLADENEREGRIRFNSLSPAPCKTDFRYKLFPAENQEQLPLPEQLMSAYLYLMGPDSKGVTGQALEANPATSA